MEIVNLDAGPKKELQDFKMNKRGGKISCAIYKIVLKTSSIGQ